MDKLINKINWNMNYVEGVLHSPITLNGKVVGFVDNVDGNKVSARLFTDCLAIHPHYIFAEINDETSMKVQSFNIVLKE